MDQVFSEENACHENWDSGWEAWAERMLNLYPEQSGLVADSYLKTEKGRKMVFDLAVEYLGKKEDARPLAGHPRFYELVETIKQLHSRKNQDYADSEHDPLSNFRLCEDAGISAYDGVLTRISDKFSRIMRLRFKQKNSQTQAVNEEPVTDTLMDLAVYSLIAIILMEEEERGKRIERC